MNATMVKPSLNIDLHDDNIVPQFDKVVILVDHGKTTTQTNEGK